MPCPKTVVHVDDNPDMAEMVTALFADYPINWLVAPTGSDGLRMARELQPDLVVLDLVLPDMSGRDVFLQMQADAELKDIPVWVLSVIWWKANLFPWHEPSIVSYTFKPFDLVQFREQVLNLLGIELE
jgi:DNA-binding response OmpR family regulator